MQPRAELITILLLFSRGKLSLEEYYEPKLVIGSVLYIGTVHYIHVSCPKFVWCKHTNSSYCFLIDNKNHYSCNYIFIIIGYKNDFYISVNRQKYSETYHVYEHYSPVVWTCLWFFYILAIELKFILFAKWLLSFFYLC